MKCTTPQNVILLVILSKKWYINICYTSTVTSVLAFYISTHSYCITHLDGVSYHERPSRLIPRPTNSAPSYSSSETRGTENGKVELILNNNHCKTAEVWISLLLSHQYWSSELPCSRLLGSSHLLRGEHFLLRERSDITYNWCLSFVISHYT